MTRTGSMAYQTNGTAALVPRRNVFTVHEGARSCQRRRTYAKTSTREQLTLFQKLEAALVIGLMLVALGLVLHLRSLESAAQFQSLLDTVPSTTITVRSGDSLWELAEEHAPEGMGIDTAVRWIREKNRLDTALIVAGQDLVVPASQG